MQMVKTGPFINTARARKKPGKTVRPGGTQVIKAKGKKPMSFKKGGLHEALSVPQNEPIPAKKKQKALAGGYGEKVRKMANFAFRGALAAGRETAGKGK
jgi:hypothetical protein